MITDVAVRRASELLNEALTHGEALPPEAQNPFQSTPEQRQIVLGLLRRWLQENRLGDGLMTGADLEALAALLVGMGPLDFLISDVSVVSINVLAHDQVWVQRSGIWEQARNAQGQTALWQSPDALRRFGTALAARSGQALEREYPVCQAYFAAPLPGRLQIDGTARTPAGVTLHIRLGRKQPITLAQMLADGGMTAEMHALLIEIAQRDIGALIVGQPNTGKTTFLEAWMDFWPHGISSAALDDRSEFYPRHPLTTIYDVSPERLRGALVDALRKNITRVAVAELRGDEAAEMLRYSGALTIWTTLHGNIDNAVLRLVALVQGAPDSPYAGLAPELVKQIIAQAFPIVVETEKLVVGGRAFFMVGRIAALDEQGNPQSVFQARFTGAQHRGFTQVSDPRVLLARFRRRVWGGVELPQPALLATIAERAPAVGLLALREYLRVYPAHARVRGLLKRLVTQDATVRQQLLQQLQTYRERVTAALEARNWGALLAVYSELDADPLVATVATEAADLESSLRPLPRAEVVRRAALVTMVQEALATATATDVRHTLALAGALERCQAEPDLYPPGMGEHLWQLLEQLGGTT